MVEDQQVVKNERISIGTLLNLSSINSLQIYRFLFVETLVYNSIHVLDIFLNLANPIKDVRCHLDFVVFTI